MVLNLMVTLKTESQVKMFGVAVVVVLVVMILVVVVVVVVVTMMMMRTGFKFKYPASLSGRHEPLAP